jgi:putative redox protein
MRNAGERTYGEVKLVDGMAFQADVGGHSLMLDAAPDAGGRARGPRPVDLILVALAGCTGMDVISILRKMHQVVTDYRVEVEGTRREEHPRIFTHIVVEHVVEGVALSPEAVQRAVTLSRDRYCSVGGMLGDDTQIDHTWRIEEATQLDARVA